MTRFNVRLAFPTGVADVTVFAIHEGDAWRVWAARDARWERLALTDGQRAQAEAAVTALADAQRDLFAKAAACEHCGATFDAEKQRAERRDRCPACKRGHPTGSYARMCGSEWCRCSS